MFRKISPYTKALPDLLSGLSHLLRVSPAEIAPLRHAGLWWRSVLATSALAWFETRLVEALPHD